MQNYDVREQVLKIYESLVSYQPKFISNIIQGLSYYKEKLFEAMKTTGSEDSMELYQRELDFINKLTKA